MKRKKYACNRVRAAAFLMAAFLIACPAAYGDAYAQDQEKDFTDVSQEDWFYEPVTNLAAEGIVNGYSDGSFKPQNSVTNSEALKMIFVAADINAAKAEEWEKWDSNIIAEAERRNIIGNADFVGDAYATREQIAEYTVKAMGWENASYADYIFEDSNLKNVNILFTKNIVTGSEGNDGYYYFPESNITRAEMSAIIVRLDNVQKERMGEIPFQIKPGIKPPELFMKENPYTTQDFINVFANMCSNNEYHRVFIYAGDSRVSDSDEDWEKLKETITEAYELAHARYPEVVCYSDTLKLSQTGRGSTSFLTLELGNDDFTSQEITSMKDKYMSDCNEILGELISSGRIDGTMTETEIARELYRYVVTTLSYDESLSTESYVGYGATENHTAVCQGYTSLYNTLCKKSGIIAEGITGSASNRQATEDHIWSLVMLDGKRTHVDTTFGDPVPDVQGRCDYSYFNVTSAYMKKDHAWDSSKFDI